MNEFPTRPFVLAVIASVVIAGGTNPLVFAQDKAGTDQLAQAAKKVKHIIGHRGSCADCPENTLASYRRAIAAGATIIEMDARTTKDGVLVSSHDADIR